MYDDKKVIMYRDTADEWRAHVLHDNGNILADSSEGYVHLDDLDTQVDELWPHLPVFIKMEDGQLVLRRGSHGKLTMAQFQTFNAARVGIWDAEGESWALTDWTNAMGGECGEAMNVAKKIRRIDTGVGGNTKGEERVALLDDLMFELADTVTYAFCVADFLKLSLEPYVVYKFNEDSEKQGIEVKI